MQQFLDPEASRLPGPSIPWHPYSGRQTSIYLGALLLGGGRGEGGGGGGPEFDQR